MAQPVCTFVIAGPQDHPLYEIDLTGPKEVRLIPMDVPPPMGGAAWAVHGGHAWAT
jgi:hypothetical protein